MKALITQRQQIDDYGVGIDILESSYIKYFENMNLDLVIASNFTQNIGRVLEESKFDIFILTGGGNIAEKFFIDNCNADQNNKKLKFYQKKRDKLELELMKYSLENNIPILAICRGMQYINAFSGGYISHLKGKCLRENGKEHSIDLICKEVSDEISLYDSVSLCMGDIIKVNNYHNDGIFVDDVANNFKILGLDTENDIAEIIYDEKNRWLGLQFHPEREIKDRNSRKKVDLLVRTWIENKIL